MKGIIVGIFCLVCVLNCKGQALRAEIIYERTYNYASIVQRLPYLTKEEKDRSILTMGNKEGLKEKYILQFDRDQSIYTNKEEKGVGSSTNYGGRKEVYYITRNFKTKEMVDIVEVLGEKYITKDILVSRKWKIMNEIKDVANFVCMKAITYDSIRNQKITAWFSDQIPFQVGPEEYFGLPGAILELDKNDGDLIITATEVRLQGQREVVKKPKMKGKHISQQEQNKIIKNYIEQSIKAQRNPYWSIRY
jgi:GLPGLI family protein